MLAYWKSRQVGLDYLSLKVIANRIPSGAVVTRESVYMYVIYQ